MTVPVPPFGPDLGKLGRLELRVVYVPNLFGTMEYLSAKYKTTKGLTK